VHSIKEIADVVKSVEQRKWQHSNSRGNTKSSTNPFPESENVLISNTKFSGTLEICGNSAEMTFEDELRITVRMAPFIVV